MYDTAVEGSLVDALRCAGCDAGIQYLKDHPIKASWEDATGELMAQYEYAIETNLANRQELASYTRIFNQFAKAAIVTLLTYWVLRSYMNQISMIVTLLLDDLIQFLEKRGN